MLVIADLLQKNRLIRITYLRTLGLIARNARNSHNAFFDRKEQQTNAVRKCSQKAELYSDAKVLVMHENAVYLYARHKIQICRQDSSWSYVVPCR